MMYPHNRVLCDHDNDDYDNVASQTNAYNLMLSEKYINDIYNFSFVKICMHIGKCLYLICKN